MVEGEKDVESLRQLGLRATTCPFGAEKWREEYTEQLRAAGVTQIVILPDNDVKGHRHADEVAASCFKAGISVTILELPGLPDGGDVTDWLAAGHTEDELEMLVAVTPPITSAPTGAINQPFFTSIGEVLSQPDSVRRWIVEDRLPADGLSLLVAKPKVGKSTAARNLCLCVARGQPWLGHATFPGRVVYLAPEEKIDDVRAHFRLMGAVADENIHMRIAQPSDDQTFKRLEEDVRMNPPALVIIDSMQRVLRIKNVNDYAEVTDKLDPYLHLARSSGGHLMLTHHMGKLEREGADGTLGSTAFHGSVDTVLMIREERGRRVFWSSQRYGENWPETVIAYDSTTGLLSVSGPAEQVREEAAAAEILDFLRTCSDAVDEGEIQRSVQGRTGTLRAALRRLFRDGRVQRTGKGVKGDPHMYSMARSTATP